ncbi:MAG: dCTP deaminase [Bdellovibrionota bacterium]
MSIKSDSWIISMAEKGMIEPFEPAQVRKGAISFGVSSYGYDFRISDEFKILNPEYGDVIDPKGDQEKMYKSIKASTYIIPPSEFVLAKTVEYFRIPRDILTICYGKSTYARCGLHVNVTPFEPEWEGFATISLINATHVPVKIYAGEGIGQLLFLQSDEACKTSYADKKGKYQAQQEITTSKIDQ